MGRERTGALFGRGQRLPLMCALVAAATGVLACSTDSTGGPPSHGGAGSDSAGANSGAGSKPEGGASQSDGGALQTGGSGGGGRGGATAYCSLGTPVAGARPAAGFCVRQFARVTAARTLVFAPNGDLFVGAPTTGTPGGSSSGPGQILVISDDDQDGVGETHVFAGDLPDIHGLALGGGYLYFTHSKKVYRTPYSVGQRQEAGVREELAVPAAFADGRWTHGLARSVGGTLFASSGEYSSCGVAPTGSIALPSMANPTVVAVGLRNPMYLRCHYKDELCAANELGEDQTTGAREKFIVIRPDTNYGYPCCFGAQEPRSSGNESACATVAPEEASFPLSDTPFGFDWEHGTWPSPYTGGVFVALHGSAYSSPRWAGTKIVFAPADPATHLPVRDAWQEFVGGFGPDDGALERPADIVFAPDGRMFFADDLGGQIYWVAPESLIPPR